MENSSYKKRVSFIENDKQTSSLVLKEFSILYGSQNINVISKDSIIFEDITSLEEIISGSEILIFHNDFSYVENEADLIKRLKGIENIVNTSLTLNVSQLVFITPFTPNYGTHYNQIITEKTIWEFSTSIDLYSKFIHLSRQEILRGLHEGMNTSILSCGNVINDKTQNKKETVFTIHPKDVAYAVLQEIESKSNHHLILVNDNQEFIEESPKLRQGNFFYKIYDLFKSDNPKRAKISLDISETKKILNKPFIETY